jgi:DNA-binding FadR family transcriptional regulator
MLSIYRQINQVRLHAQWNAMKEKILTPDVIEDYNGQHRGIYDAINERDAQAAQNLIAEHLEKARDDPLRADNR